MPIYEFTCKKCEARFEVLRGMRDTSPAPCPACGDAETMRLLSLFASQVKDRANVLPCGADAREFGGGCCGGACTVH